MLEFGKKLRVALAEKNIRKRVFAKAVKVTPQTVSYWLNEGKQPQYNNALIIEKYFKGAITLEDMGH